MKRKKVVQVILAILLGLLLAVYIAAKVHFFTRYDPNRQWHYIHAHWIYWALIAALGLLIWLIERLYPENSNRDDDSKGGSG